MLFVGWLAIGGVYVFQAFTLSRFETSVPENLRARRVHTQMEFVRCILITIVVLLDAAALLWSLHDETLWKYGTGLLASAGLASLVPAVAAKSTASSFFAGLQIALSEPIRIDEWWSLRTNGAAGPPRIGRARRETSWERPSCMCIIRCPWSRFAHN